VFAELMKSNPVLGYWLIAFAISTLIIGVYTGYFKARKIQPKGFKWRMVRTEAIVAVINVSVSSAILLFITTWLTKNGFIVNNNAPTAWWVIALEYAGAFLAFDTWFYWFHRLMHREPIYTWVHKVHHWSTSPNFMTNLSENPLESVINGGFVPLFLAAFTVHKETAILLTSTQVFMGFYVHSGYELFPRWWNKTWLTKWFITATFHDQHHRYFTVNFGGYTTIWDRICGTNRPKFEADFDKIKTRPIRKIAADTGVGEAEAA
jgi:sterol desaturase/sphingolipid hydroxylase (fatty acid hydroxylase superfamily)